MITKEARFIAKHEAQWKALEQVNRTLAKQGMKNFTKAEVRELARLFRLASFHMAYAKTHFPKGQALPYLNRLVGTTHNYFYVRESGTAADIVGYFKHGFPRAVRDTRHYSAAAMALFFLGLFFAAFSGAWFDMLGNPRAIADNLGPPEGWDGSLMSAFFVVNNTTVAINAFVWGIFAGIGTVYVLLYNGLIIGALFGFLHTSGADMVLAYSLILPHGVVELAAIFLSGGAGLMIAKGMLIPGMHSRKHSVVMHTRKAVSLLPGIAFLLLVAAVIEGFFTPLSGVSPYMKLVFAALTGIGLALWFLPKRSRKDEA